MPTPTPEPNRPPAEGGEVPSALALAERAWELRREDPRQTVALATEALARADGREPLARAHALLARGYGQLQLSRNHEARHDVETALELFERENDRDGALRALNTLGIIHGETSAFVEALKAFLAVRRLHEESGDRRGLADALNNVAVIHEQLGDFSAALEHYSESLRLAREVGYAAGRTRSLHNLAVVLLHLQRPKDALEHLEESLSLTSREEDRHFHALTLLNIGRAHEQLDDLPQALYQARRAAEIMESLDNTAGLANALDTMGSIQRRLQAFEHAEECLRRALALKREANSRKGQATTMLALGRLLLQRGSVPQATEVLHEALDLGLELGLKQEVYHVHGLLADAYERLGEPATALEHYRRYAEVKDEVFNEASDRKLRAAQVGFEVEQAHKEKEIYRLKNVELAKANHELKALTRSLREADQQKSRLLGQLEKQAREDGLTGLYNRRHFDQCITDAFAEARRSGSPLCVSLSDVDNFKKVNDTFGHAVGDEVLKAVAKLMQRHTRDSDLVARYGGEEFIVMLPGTTPRQAAAVCERIRAAVADHPWHEIDPDLRVTLSMGLAGDLRLDNHERLISLADERLYKAKESGKNRVEVGDDPELFADPPTPDADDSDTPEAAEAADTSETTATTGDPETAEVPALEALTRGFRVGRRGAPLEEVTTQLGSVELLAARAGLEVTEGTLEAGGRLTVMSDPSDPYPEIYYLLEGSLQLELPDGETVLEPGDHLLVEELQECAILTAQGDVRFLYLSPRPSFHEISEELEQLRGLAVEVELKDGYTADHCSRLQTLAYATGVELELSQHRLHLLDYGAYLHDVGKIRVPTEILLKPTSLTADEWHEIRLHPLHGEELLANTFMKEAATIVAQHHERFDGSGYPRGLKGDDILLESYIVAVVDTFDAMTSDRPYRGALPTEQALQEIRGLRDRHFPGAVVDAFERALARLEPAPPESAPESAPEPEPGVAVGDGA